MKIELYADVVCPWAYVGKRHLDQALALLGEESAIEVGWRPFLIDPTAPRPSVPLAEALADPWIRAELDRCSPADRGADGRIRRAEEVAAGLGIGPGWSPRWRSSSWAAQRLIQSAARQGWAVQAEVADALMAAHFVAGEDLGRVEVVGAIAAEFGLPAPLPAGDDGTALVYLEPGAKDDLERATREAYLTGLALGVATSPTYVVNGVVVAHGAQPPELLAEAFRAASAARPEAEEVVRLRGAEALIRKRNPYGALYLLDGLRPAYDGDRELETVAARALLATGNPKAAREKLAPLIERHPHDVELHWMMGHSLRRLGDAGAASHLALAGALDV